MRPTRHLPWIIALVILLLLVLPLPVAERFTSPNQDGQYAIHPIKAYGLIVALLRASRSARLSSSGRALGEAKRVFPATGLRPTGVKLLYFPSSKPYVYYTRAGTALTILVPPRLVWEVWGVVDLGQVAQSRPGSTSATSAQPVSTGADTTAAEVGAGVEVIGFMDYVTGEHIGTEARPNPRSG